MSEIVATVKTAHASRYLQQLCKHWSHRFEVSFTAETGEVALPLGKLRLEAGESGLRVVLDPVSDGEVAKMKEVVTSHLNRFAFREAPLPLAWQS